MILYDSHDLQYELLPHIDKFSILNSKIIIYMSKSIIFGSPCAEHLAHNPSWCAKSLNYGRDCVVL